jgi:membrane-associated phospholipid phosphatase
MTGDTGDTGNTGDTGDTGDVGAWIGRSAARLPDRVDLPFLTEPGVAGVTMTRASFGPINWSPSWFAWRILADFGATGWQTGIVVAPPQAPTNAEIEALKTMVLDERPDALGEILGQDKEFLPYFLALMGATPSTHSATALVMNAAHLVATMAAMHFKTLYDRVRPSQLVPALLPPIPVPGHASYPSGHSTQAHLFARCATEILQATQGQGISLVLTRLADRIARNREIAGLHYPSDSAAGASLASSLFTILMDETIMPQPLTFKAAMTAAKAEWA